MSALFRFAHLSDWHATTLVGGGPALFRGKRISGWASWRINRRRQHDPAILEAAMRDVHAQAPDRVLVTGDLTHVSLESEFKTAKEQLTFLGSPEQVFLVPGNHDCYVPAAAARSWDHWADYLAGDSPGQVEEDLAPHVSGTPGPGLAPRYVDYPTLRVRDGLAMIGLCSSIPTPIFKAGGTLGSAQLERLDGLLAALGDRGLCRVLLIHHPVARRGEPARRALWDGEALREVLARQGAELVLHGHKHRRRINHVTGPHRPVPIIGVPSSSEVGSKPDKAAQYHLYSVNRGNEADEAYRLECEVRGYNAQTQRFESQEALALEAAV